MNSIFIKPSLAAKLLGYSERRITQVCAAGGLNATKVEFQGEVRWGLPLPLILELAEKRAQCLQNQAQQIRVMIQRYRHGTH